MNNNLFNHTAAVSFVAKKRDAQMVDEPRLK